MPACYRKFTSDHSHESTRVSLTALSKVVRSARIHLQNPTGNQGLQSILWERHPCYIRVTLAETRLGSNRLAQRLCKRLAVALDVRIVLGLNHNPRQRLRA
jgi:hypothetical protein